MYLDREYTGDASYDIEILTDQLKDALTPSCRRFYLKVLERRRIYEGVKGRTKI